MKVLKSIRLRPGGRFLSDIEVSDSIWKPDFDIVDRYQTFANELMRIALLGLGVYGFLIREVYMKNIGKTAKEMIPIPAGTISCLCWGSISLGLSLALVLIHRFFSTACLFYQIIILRSLKRLENSHWTEEEKTNERNFLVGMRDVQRKKSRLSHYVLISAAILFAIGFFFVITEFLIFIHTI